MPSRLLTWALVLLCLVTLFLSASPVRADEGAADVADATTDEVVEDEPLEVTDEEDDDADPEAAEELEEEYEPDFEEEFVLEASPDVTSHFIFPAYADKVLEIGEETTLLTVLSNNGDNSFNLTEMGAFLQSHYDLTYYIQNYSRSEPDVILEPGEQITLEYVFTPHERLEPETFHFSAYVQYNDTADDMMYRSTFFNETIRLVDRPTSLQDQLQSILGYVVMLAVVGGAAYNFMSKKTGSKKRAAAALAADAEDDDDDWGTVYTQKKRPVRGSSAKKRDAKKGN